MISHTIITFNLLRPSNINLKLSAYAQLNGAFHYSAISFEIPGTYIIPDKNPVIRGSWSTKGI